MHQINCQKLTIEAFRKYGDFSDFINPDGEKLGEAPSEFFRDRMQVKLGKTNILSLSALKVLQRPLVIDLLEYHNYCGEAILPIDADIIVQLAPATAKGQVPYEKIEAFYVPKGTAITINPGIWHHAPFVINAEQAHIFCMLPERTYENDANVIDIPKQKVIEIKLNNKAQ